MVSLPSDLRSRLERTVIAARDVAEEGARRALEQLAVPNPEPFPTLSAEQRELRKKLRAKARQLGDFLNKHTGVQVIDHLVAECAYEHWHQMLFARFLAENHLLMHPSGVSVSLEECEELAADEGASDGWELAARYASKMLPQIFRPDDPVLQIHYTPEHQRQLENLLADLPSEVFTADDSLGWVYQFWQSKKKDEVNASGNKIGADELPAVTQLFTEQYMVDFLLHNTLGSWWAGRHLSDSDLKNAASEDELRAKVALPGVSFDYLRFVKSPRSDSSPLPLGEGKGEGGGKGEGDEVWTPAAGTFAGWPKTTAELKVLDPCCGSGHFLVTAFDILVAFRMQEEGLSARDACDVVLRDNLFGLEIDPRCTQIAAFALAMQAWKYPNAGGHRVLPRLNIACSGLSVGSNEEEWRKLGGGDPRLTSSLMRLYRLFKQAPLLGSLIDPTPDKDIVIEQASFDELEPLLEKVLRDTQDEEMSVVGVAAQGLGRAAKVLSGTYHLVATNVPYLARGKQSEELRQFSDNRFPLSKGDVATAFLDRFLDIQEPGNTCSFVIAQNWLYQTVYEGFRVDLLEHRTFRLLAPLGPGAFETIGGEVVKVALIVIQTDTPNMESRFHGIKELEELPALEKAMSLRKAEIRSTSQSAQMKNPRSRIVIDEIDSSMLLQAYATGLQGIATGDYPRLGRCTWEVPWRLNGWEFQQSTVEATSRFGGREHAIFWENGQGELVNSPQARVQGLAAHGKWGIAVSQMTHLPVCLSTGEFFDNNTAVILPTHERYLPAIWTYCSSSRYAEEVRRIDQALKVTNASLVEVPFDLEHWQKVAEEKYPTGLPKPYSEDPTQWIFHGHPTKSEEPLQVAVARLLGYQWPAELDPGMELSNEAREWVKRAESLLHLEDRDGIVCIPPVRGEKPAADRLREVLAAAYESDWSPSKEAELLNSVECPGKSLDFWLREKFLEQHCKLFHHRPFIWHIWDGRKDGFGVLVNYHKLDRKLLETLTYTYLGDWIRRQEDAVKNGEGPAEARLNAANNLKAILEKILEGEPPFDIFVRWKPIHEQPIGWEPDLNDGVRLNIRPFMAKDIEGGRTGAGILRWKPNIKWDKDRGKEPERPREQFPWFWNGGKFTGDRVNEVHLSIEEKKVAREKKS